jgi:hypothetical protein
VIQQQLEEYAEANEKEEVEDENRLQQLEYFRKHPVNLNSAGKEDLEALIFLNSLQVFHFLEYRRILGELIDIYELQAVPGFDLRTINKILPFIKIESTEKLSGIVSRLNEGKHQLILRWSKTLEKSKGYDLTINDHFLGDASQVYLRYNFQTKYVQFGLTAEKDKGEQFFKGAQSKGFDFYSFHFFIKNRGKLRALALGDYVINLGQGLIHWQSMGNGKGMQLLHAKREAPVLQPYRSAGEFNFLRGTAIHYRVKGLDLLAFASYRKLSANVSDSSETYSAFNTSGLHRTKNEIQDRNKIGYISAGAAIQLYTRFVRLGIHTVYYGTSWELRKTNYPYNHFIPNAKDLQYLGFDYAGTYKNLHFFGELAADNRKQFAFTHGMIISVDAKVDLAIHYRKMDVGYQALFGNAFTENSIPGNEAGLFCGIVLKPVKGLALYGFSDFFTFPWLKYRVDAPSKGSDFFLALDYQPTRQSLFQVIFRIRQKTINEGEENFQYPQIQVKRSLRLHISREISKALEFRSRFETMSFARENHFPERGSMLYIEGIMKRKSIQLGLRLQWFDTESYNSRIYNYEADVLFSSSIAVLSEEGFRYYINSNFELF